VAAAFAAIIAVSGVVGQTQAQVVGGNGRMAGIGSGGLRPFVIATVPVVGRNGTVGGVSIDAKGIVDRAAVQTTAAMRAAQLRQFQAVPHDAARRSGMRKISLRRLDAAIADHRQRGQALPDDILYLAGLQQIRYVFAFPDRRDIVLAGHAEGWQVNASGDIVGQASGCPVLQLDDLVVAIRSTARGPAGEKITCSIDPADEGLARYQRLLSSRSLQMSRGTIRLLEKSLGPSVVSVTGVEPDTHFAHVMVAADFMMKRLAMHFEPSPVADLPSYLQLVAESGQLPQNALFRLWLAPDYDSVLRDPEGYAWELNGLAVQALTEDSLFTAERGLMDAGRADPVAQRWADRFTEQYDMLAERMPIFAKLRHCVNLAVVGAILAKQRLIQRADVQLHTIIGPNQADVARMHTPRHTPSRASFVKQGHHYVISLSGGVDLDCWSPIQEVGQRNSLRDVRRAAYAGAAAGRWWWD
jgi:hypothetical protein